jgi:hypothetical protein
MGDAGEREPRWNEREVGLILRRALELQEEQKQIPAAPARADGASLADLEEVAREVGIEPALVRRAAAELDNQPRPVATSRFMGGPTSIVFERVLRGEASEAALEKLVVVVQEALGEHGQPAMVGRTFTWTSVARSGPRGSHGRQIAISVRPRDGATVIHIEEKLRSTAGGLFGGLLGGVGGGSSGVAMGIGIGALNSVAAAVVLWLCGVGGAYAGARALYRRAVSKRTQELRELLLAMGSELEAANAAAALPEGVRRAEENPALPSPVARHLLRDGDG